MVHSNLLVLIHLYVESFIVFMLYVWAQTCLRSVLYVIVFVYVCVFDVAKFLQFIVIMLYQILVGYLISI